MNEKEILSKIKTIDDAILWRAKLEREKKSLVMTNGCFDILHRGHASYLMRARALGDALILAINSDNSARQLKGPARPVTNELDRAYLLSCFSFVDAVVIFDSVRCENIINRIKPDIYAKGADYNLETMDRGERAALENVGAKIEFIEFINGYSSSKIIGKIGLAKPSDRF